MGMSREAYQHYVIFNNYLQPTDCVPAPFGKPHGGHDLFYSPHFKEWFWCMAAGNRIMRSEDFVHWEEWKPIEEDAREHADRTGNIVSIRTNLIRGKREKKLVKEGKALHHINSIWFDGEMAYVFCHNRGNSEWIKLHGSFDSEIVDRGLIGQQAHNIWLTDGVPTCVDSKGSRVVTNDGTVLYETALTEFCRGIAWNEEFWLLGVSNTAKREDRRNGIGSVRMLSPDWEEGREFNIRGSGQIYSIRLIDTPDPVTHNGLLCPLER